MSGLLTPLLRPLRHWLPSQCQACRRWPSAPLCGACLERFARPRLRCGCCALPVPDAVAICGTCLRSPGPLAACHAAVDYAYPWSDLLGRFKFGGEPGLAGVLAELLRGAPGMPQVLAEADVVLPMPLSRERLAERGFNQSLEIARRLGAGGRLQPALLLRPRHRPAQSTLPLADRRDNVRQAFAVDPLRVAEVRGRRVLLVDDVMTSGASLAAAAGVLLAAGAAQVTAAVVARTP